MRSDSWKRASALIAAVAIGPVLVAAPARAEEHSVVYRVWADGISHMHVDYVGQEPSSAADLKAHKDDYIDHGGADLAGNVWEQEVTMSRPEQWARMEVGQPTMNNGTVLHCQILVDGVVRSNGVYICAINFRTSFNDIGRPPYVWDGNH